MTSSVTESPNEGFYVTEFAALPSKINCFLINNDKEPCPHKCLGLTCLKILEILKTELHCMFSWQFSNVAS